MVDPEKISMVEMTTVNGQARVFITIEGKQVELEGSLEQFLKMMDRSGEKLNKQFFAI